MAKVSITLAELSMIFGRTVMADLSFHRSVNWPMCHLTDQSDIRIMYIIQNKFFKVYEFL